MRRLQRHGRTNYSKRGVKIWNNKTVSVVFPAYNEEEGIYAVVNDFKALGLVDEIIVVDNNSKDNTFKIASSLGVITVKEPIQGYGAALKKGLNTASSDIIIMCEPDCSFFAEDIKKLLLYLEGFDVVFGSRTSKSMIWSGAKMNWPLRMGNVVVAKLLEYFHNGPCLTDVGCTFKAIKREALDKIKDKLTITDSHFSPDFMITCIRSKFSCVEIPVTYRERIGQSKITSDTPKAIKLGLVMVWLIIKRRFQKV